MGKKVFFITENLGITKDEVVVYVWLLGTLLVAAIGLWVLGRFEKRHEHELLWKTEPAYSECVWRWAQFFGWILLYIFFFGPILTMLCQDLLVSLTDNGSHPLF